MLSDGPPLHLDLRMLLQWVCQDGQWKARVILDWNALSWMVSGRVNHVEQSASSRTVSKDVVAEISRGWS